MADSPPLKTYVSPEGVAVLAVAGTVAAVAAMPLMLAPGLLAYAVLTYLRYERWRDDAEAAARDRDRPPSVAGLSAERAALVRRAAEAQRRIAEAVKQADSTYGAMLEPSVERARALVASIAALAHRLEAIEEHLRRDAPTQAGHETRTLEARMNATNDPVARQGYVKALEQQRAKEAAMHALEGRAARIDAQLATMLLALDTVAAQLLRAATAGEGAAANVGVRVAEELAQLRVDADALAEAVDETEAATRGEPPPAEKRFTPRG